MPSSLWKFWVINNSCYCYRSTSREATFCYFGTRHPLTRLYIFANSIPLCFYCRCRAIDNTRCVTTNYHWIPSSCLKHALSFLLMGHLQGEGAAMHEVLQAANQPGTPFPGPCCRLRAVPTTFRKKLSQHQITKSNQNAGEGSVCGEQDHCWSCLSCFISPCSCPTITHRAPRSPHPTRLKHSLPFVTLIALQASVLTPFLHYLPPPPYSITDVHLPYIFTTQLAIHLTTGLVFQMAKYIHWFCFLS